MDWTEQAGAWWKLEESEKQGWDIPAAWLPLGGCIAWWVLVDWVIQYVLGTCWITLFVDTSRFCFNTSMLGSAALVSMVVFDMGIMLFVILLYLLISVLSVIKKYSFSYKRCHILSWQFFWIFWNSTLQRTLFFGECFTYDKCCAPKTLNCWASLPNSK